MTEPSDTPEPLTFTYSGKTYALRPDFPHMPVARFTSAAQKGFTLGSPDALAFMYDLLSETLDAADFARLYNDLNARGAHADAMLDACTECISAVFGRPTEPPSDSSAGASSTASTSTGGSSQPDTRPYDPAVDGPPEPSHREPPDYLLTEDRIAEQMAGLQSVDELLSGRPTG